jgi:hypothetical protein
MKTMIKTLYKVAVNEPLQFIGGVAMLSMIFGMYYLVTLIGG